MSTVLHQPGFSELNGYNQKDHSSDSLMSSTITTVRNVDGHRKRQHCMTVNESRDTWGFGTWIQSDCRCPEHEMVLADMHEKPGTPWKCCPRSTLKRLSQTLRMEFNLVREGVLAIVCTPVGSVKMNQFNNVLNISADLCALTCRSSRRVFLFGGS